ncbi:T9SS type A sorting domain-containing protein [Flavobacterium sp.]|uniref:T9SS type A sorting domain-containing protein n=1 Tax=Flavobacterium sp. TaxID=239 RepID=UPI003C32D984
MKSKKILSCLLVLVMTFSQSFAQFNKNKDILIAQFDSKPDPDDIHAIAALGCILAHNDFNNINFYAVAGAYGIQGGNYISAPALFNLAFGTQNINWTDAKNDRSASVTRIKNKAKAVLQAGGKVYVQEAGQSDITRDWCQALLDDGITSNSLKNNVIVVQHSQWNEDKTTAADLTWVKNNTTYTKIGDGNGDGNGTPSYRSTNTSFLTQAKNSQNVKAKTIWREADRVIQTNGHFPDHSSISTGGVDFSDCVENWWIFNLTTTADNVTKFWSKFITNPVSNPVNNTVNFVNPPSSIISGASFNVQIAYQASQQYEIVAIINSGTGTWLANKTQTVAAGSGTATLVIPQSTAWPVGNNYKLGIAIRPIGGGFSTNLDYKSVTFNIVSNNAKGVNLNKTAIESIAYDNEFVAGEGTKTRKVENQNGKSINTDNSFIVYPNPFKQELTLQLANNHNYSNVQIIDEGGKVLGSKVIIGESTVDLSDTFKNSKPGMYFVKLIGFDNKTVKIIKK